MKTNALFYGDNLVWLRDQKYFPDNSVDLIYLDPPFNSKADYNLIFNEPGKLDKSQAQIKVFDDTWNWDSEASAIALNELAQNKPQIAEFISWLGRQGKPYDVASAEALAKKDKREFEIWAVVTLVGAAPREHDGGVDGIFGFVEKDKQVRTIIVQVKGSDVLNPGMVRDLIGTVKKEGAALGLLVTLKEPSNGMRALAVHSEPYKSELWLREFPNIQIRTVDELFAGK